MDSARLDAIARERLSSAYFPDRKFTMLPPGVAAAFSLDAGCERILLDNMSLDQMREAVQITRPCGLRSSAGIAGRTV